MLEYSVVNNVTCFLHSTAMNYRKVTDFSIKRFVILIYRNEHISLNSFGRQKIFLVIEIPVTIILF